MAHYIKGLLKLSRCQKTVSTERIDDFQMSPILG